MEKTIKFKSRGIVLGYCWGGGKGSYEAKRLEADTKENLIQKATNMLNDGSLDGGMGFECLKGALLDITEITTVIIDGKPFINEESEYTSIGNLSEDEYDNLISISCIM